MANLIENSGAGKSGITHALAPLQAWWSLRAPRERMLLGSGAVVLGLILVYVLAWQPASDGIARVGADVQTLRAQQADLQRMADEVRGLRGSAPAVALAAQDRAEAVKRSLMRAGFEADAAIGAEEGGRMRVKVADIDYALWIVWLGTAEAELGARIARSNITALPASSGAGHVRGDVLFEWVERDASGR